MAFVSQPGMFLALIVEATNTSALAVKFETLGNIKSMTVHAYSVQATKPHSQILPPSMSFLQLKDLLWNTFKKTASENANNLFNL